jgi:hypothetical protein
MVAKIALLRSAGCKDGSASICVQVQLRICLITIAQRIQLRDGHARRRAFEVNFHRNNLFDPGNIPETAHTYTKRASTKTPSYEPLKGGT